MPIQTFMFFSSIGPKNDVSSTVNQSVAALTQTESEI